MTLNDLIKELQEIKKDFGGKIEVCVCTDPREKIGISVDYPEVVDVKEKGRVEYENVGEASLDGPARNADDQVVFILSC